MKKLLIVDGNSLVNRAFYALPLLTNQNGEYSNAVYGFCNILIKFITEQHPDYLCVAFDHSRHTFRTDMYAEYKGTRKKMPDELASQMPILKNLLQKMNIKIFEENGIEADDIIGTVAKNSGVSNIILSGDRDVLQLIDNNTEVWLTKKGITDVQVVNQDNIKDLFGVSPSQIIDLKSLMGDSSDNIPGVSGIGEITAKKLIADNSTLDGVYANIESTTGKLREKLENGKDSAYLSYKLATIKTDCNIDVNIQNFGYDFPFNNNVKEIFKNYEFKSLLKRNELFLNQEDFVQEKITEVFENKQTLDDIKSIEKILKDEKIEYFAFNFLNDYLICFNSEKYYSISKNIQLNDILLCLKDVFESDFIQKITFDLKSHLHLFGNFVNVKGNIFDLSIAEYLVHAGEKYGAEYTIQEYASVKNELEKIMDKYELTSVYYDIELPLTYVLYEMENNGFYVNKTTLDELAEKYKEEVDDLTEQIFDCVGYEFNINSPKQVASVLFDELGLSDFNNKKHSTSIENLIMLQYSHEVVPLIIRYRKIQKLSSTYLEPYRKIVEEKGECIHTIFNQTLTSTGRLSSSEPNLQNIPVRDDEGKNLRKMFISRFNDGEIISADYSQIELRLLASLSGDKNLIEAYKNNQDIHRSTASQIFDKPIELVTEHERSSAKATNFGIIYGISAYGLANQIGESPKNAKKFLDKYLATYPDVTVYMKNNIEFAKQNGYVKTLFGRIRKINEISSSNFNIRQFGERVAMNMPLQGTASDVIKIAMIKVNNELKNKKLKSKLILQIHDELMIDSPKEEIEIVKKILHSCMENVVNLIVPLIVNISSGKTWFDAK